ncbi:MAG: helix-turn-helix domain-containing protein [Pseudomonadota bacterium]
MPKLITISEFQRAYGVSRSTIYRQSKAGKLPIVKVGRASRIREDHAQSWLESLPKTASESALDS